jgi:hypothetical protein
LEGKIKASVTSKNGEDIKLLHDSLNTAIEKKCLPKWSYAEDDKEQNPTIADTAYYASLE